MQRRRYKRAELAQIVSRLLKTKTQLLPIGNHELKRHQVYKVVTAKKNYVFKFYYQSNYCDREIATLKLLADEEILAPKLVSYGKFDGDREWMMIEFLDGVPLFKVMKHLKEDNLREIYQAMGEELGKLHQIHFEFFGDWKDDCSPVNEFIDLKSAFIKRGERVFRIVNEGNIENADVIKKAYDLLMSNLDVLEHAKEAVLCHLDYDTRNILVKRVEGRWKFSTMLDFEHTIPYDRIADFTHLYIKDFKDDPKYKVDFIRGYNKYHQLEMDQEKFNLYLLYHALNICSWAYDIAPDYYELGLNLLKDFLKDGLHTKHEF